jgi:DNA-binding response OmpR family regulator
MNSNAKFVLAVDRDSYSLGEFGRALDRIGCTLIQTNDLNHAQSLTEKPDCLAAVIERNLSALSGLQFTKILRNSPQSVNLPIVMISATATEFDIIEGLESGVDDYMPKPLRAEELVQRVKAIARRRSYREQQPALAPTKPIAVGLWIDENSSTAMANDQPLDLTFTEFKLLASLVRAPNRLMSRSRLLQVVWQDEGDGRSRKVDVYIRRIRAVLKAADLDGTIQTARNEGYLFSPNKQSAS